MTIQNAMNVVVVVVVWPHATIVTFCIIIVSRYNVRFILQVVVVNQLWDDSVDAVRGSYSVSLFSLMR